MKRIIIIGATSGIGKECAKLFIERGYITGIAGRRIAMLEELKQIAPNRVYVIAIDLTKSNAAEQLNILITEMGGADIIFNCAGVGFQNRDLNNEVEMKTIETNVAGFVRISNAAFDYFSKIGFGQFAAITSIAGTKGLGVAPAYSATKRFQNTYIQALAQLAKINGMNITFTDIRPGFVDTALLSDNRKYPILMSAGKVAKIIVGAIENKRRIIIIDWRYKILVLLWRLIPNRLWEHLAVKN